MTLFVWHLEIEEAFAGFSQARGGCGVADSVVLEIVQPFFDGRGGYVVELVHANDVVFGEDVFGCHSTGLVAPS